MRTTLLTTSAIMALVIGGTPALAQSSGSSGQAGAKTSSSSSQAASPSSQSKPKMMTQDKVRQVMKDAGFTNVNIIDAAYLVQATTKDGDQIMVLLNAPMMNSASSAQTGSSSSTGGNPQLLVRSLDHTRSMEELLEAAQKLRETIQALAQQPPGPQRKAALDSARDALLLTQRAMVQLPAELRVEGGHVHAASAWPKAMARLDEAARSLRESVQAMATQPAGERRNTAMATALKALTEAEQAMIALPDYESPK